MPGVGTYISWLRRCFPGSAPSETRGGVGRNISVSASYNRAVGASHCRGFGQRRQRASTQRARGSDLRVEVLATDCDSAELNDPKTMVLHISMAGGIRAPCSNPVNVTFARDYLCMNL
ncbi:hypothetical protein HPB52_017965 [Rhipicephalus sanguineus]|uniref:Uncharacterized protein n=1 Tax=Rhipicephalus sanguineus TaxID=34632 RepID=A0A9D4QBN2_RHISA|nr:hypothetical protein HPB52_017965 [Rhipicephalus sanguineus]